MKKLTFTLITYILWINMLNAQTPIAYYPFSGNANDAAGSNNGTVNGATLTADRFGNANSAYAFDGVDDFIGLPTGSVTNYTLIAWVKFDGSPSNKNLIVFTDASGPGGAWSSQMRTGNAVFQNYCYPLNPILLEGTTNISASVWYHVAVSASANGQMKIYVNGQLDATPLAVSGTPWAGGDRFELARASGDFKGFFEGVIDDVKIYNTQLTDAQVLADYNGTPLPPTPAPTPVASYPFTGNANDAVGTNNGAVNGATLTTDRYGNPNSAYSFDGVDDVIAFNSPFTTASDNFTITAWVKRASASSGGQIVSNGRNPGGGFPASDYDGYSYGTGSSSLAANYHAVIAPIGGCAAQGTGWEFTALVREAGVTKLYLNGVQCPNTFTDAPFTPTQNAFIGALNGNGIAPFEGSIDDVNIYNAALTTSQIAAKNDCIPLSVAGDQDESTKNVQVSEYITSTDCRLIGRVVPKSPQLTTVFAKAFVASAPFFFNEKPALARRFVINPQPLAAEPATITLYVLQQEFTDFNNTNPETKLPQSTTDLANADKIRIVKYDTPNFDAGTGLPTAGTGVEIIPSDVFYNTAKGWWEIKFDVTSFSLFLVTNANFTILPLDLLSFDAKLVGKREAGLSWVTTREKDLANFEVESSADGQVFNKVGNVVAKNAAGTHNYAFTTNMPGKLGYFRLKMIDKDGKYRYSEIRTLKTEELIITSYPNPVTNEMIVDLTGYPAGTIRIVDMQGGVLSTLRSVEGINRINTSKLASGMYILQVQVGLESEKMKFLKTDRK